MTSRTWLLCVAGLAASPDAAAQTLELDMTAANRAPHELVVADRAAVTVAGKRNVFHE